MNNFERYTPTMSTNNYGRITWLTSMKVGDCYVLLNKTKQDLYQRIYAHQRRTNKEFSYLKCINGIVV